MVNAWPQAGEMSVASITRLLNSKGVGFPRWKTVADFVQVCREALSDTGVNPDTEIGTMELWHTIWKQLNDVHLGNAEMHSIVLDGEDLSTDLDSAESRVHGRSIGHVPRHASDGRLCSTLDEILFKRWFGYRGTELLDWAERGQPLAAFELGILLTLRGLLPEGSLFVRRAASLDPRLELNLRLDPADKLYGRIPSDICHRVGIGYAYEGLTDAAQEWHDYARSLNGIPMIGVLSPPGRHAVPADVLDLQPVRHAPLDPNEVLEVDTAYHEVYGWTPEPKEDREILSMPLSPLSDAELFMSSAPEQHSSQDDDSESPEPDGRQPRTAPAESVHPPAR
ncbi:hypothetical protein FE391_10460 [Nonomuraea sp. KC401]|uniref:hypothetical protein n=1 Tax=unclassified Nonomuraea TaxID=2593643 RepID=UPI0010FD937A|nr:MULTISPECIES: hypothetical protein [unclassified Nonomuraea]NBE93259.1 hypothetical protein [Nonomuraea sp. K271]TLF78004.1 hypothetical protein FE391_10460 [Nonomuraea sp. KC401]